MNPYDLYQSVARERWQRYETALQDCFNRSIRLSTSGVSMIAVGALVVRLSEFENGIPELVKWSFGLLLLFFLIQTVITVFTILPKDWSLGANLDTLDKRVDDFAGDVHDKNTFSKWVGNYFKDACADNEKIISRKVKRIKFSIMCLAAQGILLFLLTSFAYSGV